MKLDNIRKVPHKCLTHSKEVLSKHLGSEWISSHGNLQPFHPVKPSLIFPFLLTLVGVGSPLEHLPYSA